MVERMISSSDTRARRIASTSDWLHCRREICCLWARTVQASDDGAAVVALPFRSMLSAAGKSAGTEVGLRNGEQDCGEREPEVRDSSS